jgi:cobalamin biosynthesis protein CobD/CbiB
MWWFVLNWEITFYKVMVCVLCLSLMFLETAFAVCVGCMIYKMILNKNPHLCPGGTCELRQREAIQTFNPIQGTIAIITAIALTSGVYLFLAKTESKTFFGQFLHDAVLTKTQLKKEENQKYQKELNKEFENDNF